MIDKLGEHELPYIDAINELRKISSLKSPKEKLGALLMMHSLMKSAVVDFHRGKEEVCSMDEELPILIYILSQANLKNGAAEFNLIDDYVQLDPSLESERRLMTNLKVICLIYSSNIIGITTIYCWWMGHRVLNNYRSVIYVLISLISSVVNYF